VNARRWARRSANAIYAPPWCRAGSPIASTRCTTTAARRPWRNTRWLGTDVLKCPLDLWIYQELLHEIRPDWIIETGTAFGGSASYFASLCDVLGRAGRC
jgi:cephalosporin hydroxylase